MLTFRRNALQRQAKRNSLYFLPSQHASVHLKQQPLGNIVDKQNHHISYFEAVNFNIPVSVCVSQWVFFFGSLRTTGVCGKGAPWYRHLWLLLSNLRTIYQCWVLSICEGPLVWPCCASSSCQATRRSTAGLSTTTSLLVTPHSSFLSCYW